MMPVMAYNLLEIDRILAAAARVFTERCVVGDRADRERCERRGRAESSPCVTALAPVIGYDAAAAIAKESFATGKTVRELCLEKQVLPPDELARVLDPRAQTEGGIVEGAVAGG